MATTLTNSVQEEGTIYLFGVKVDNTRYETALKYIHRFIVNNNGFRARQVFFANVHSIHLARHNPELRQCINRADLVLPDGSGLNLAGKLLGTPIIENLNGTDFTPKVLSEAEANGWTVYLLGSEAHIVEQCRERILHKYSRLKIVGFRHGNFLHEEDQLIVEDINEKRPDILLVALGSPIQEKWIAQHALKLNAGVCLAVGGLFDFLSGIRKRAPLWMRRLGMEWLYRFFQNPINKWDRIFIEIPLFLVLLFVSRFAFKRPKPVDVGRRFSS